MYIYIFKNCGSLEENQVESIFFFFFLRYNSALAIDNEEIWNRILITLIN